MAHVNAALTQSAYRLRNDDGSEAAATWIAAENTGASIAVDTTFRVRFVVQETAGGGENNVTFQLQVQLNSGGWTNVTTSSSVVRAVTGTVADGTTTTDQIGGTGSFLADEVCNDGLSDLVNPSFAANEHTEAEFTVEIIGADVADQDLVELRVVRSGGTLDAWTQTPQITVSEAAGDVLLAGSAAGSSTGAGVLSGDVPLAGAAAGGSTADGVLTVNGAGGGGEITVVGTPQVGTAGNGGDITLTFDVAPVEGDVVYVLFMQGASGTANPSPSTAGYTAVHTHTAVTPWVGVHRKVMGATPDTSVTCQGTGSAQSAGAAIAIVLRGVDTTTPEDATPTTSGPTTSTNPDCPAITTTTAGAWVLALVAYDGTDADVNTIDLEAAGYTDAGEAHGVDTQRANVTLAYKEIATAGAEDPAAFVVDSSTWYAITLATRPAGVAAGDVLLVGTAAGSSTAQGLLSGEVFLAASAAGSSTATGTLTTAGEITLAGTADGSSTAQGLLSGEVPLAGTSGGTSTVAANLSVDLVLTGNAGGSSTADGNLTIEGTVNLAGTAAGTSTATGSLTADIELTGSAAGSSTAAGNLTVELLDVFLVGAADGGSTAEGVISALVALSGTVTGTSSAVAVLTAADISLRVEAAATARALVGYESAASGHESVGSVGSGIEGA